VHSHAGSRCAACHVMVFDLDGNCDMVWVILYWSSCQAVAVFCKLQAPRIAESRAGSTPHSGARWPHRNLLSSHRQPTSRGSRTTGGVLRQARAEARRQFVKAEKEAGGSLRLRVRGVEHAGSRMGLGRVVSPAIFNSASSPPLG